MKNTYILILLLLAGLTVAFDFNSTNVYLQSGETPSFVNFTYNNQTYYLMKINNQESIIFYSNNTPVTDQNAINQLISAYYSSQFSQLPFQNIENQINASFSNVIFYYGGCLQGINSFLSMPYATYNLNVIIPNQGYNCKAQYDGWQDLMKIYPAQNTSMFELNQSVQQFYGFIQQQDVTNIISTLKTIQTLAQQLDSAYPQINNDFTQYTNFCLGTTTNTAAVGMFLSPTQQNENITCFYQSQVDQGLKNIATQAQQGSGYNIPNLQNQIYSQTSQRIQNAEAQIEKNQSISALQYAEALYQKTKNFYAGTAVSTSFLSTYEQQAQQSLNASNFSINAINNFDNKVQQLYNISIQFNLTTYSLSNTLNTINSVIERVGRSDPRIQQAQENYTNLYNQYKNFSQQLSNGNSIAGNQLQAIQTQADSLSNYTSSLQPPENQFGWLQIMAVIVILAVIIGVLFYFRKFKREPPKITDLKTEYSLNTQSKKP